MKMNDILRQVFHNFVWYGTAEGVTLGIGFIVISLISRYLGSEQFGYYTYAFAFAGIFTVIIDAGLTVFAYRYIRDFPQKIAFFRKHVAYIKIIFGIISALFIVGLQFLILGKNDYVVSITVIILLHFLFLSLSDFLRALLRIYNNIRTETIFRIFQYILLVILIWCCILQDAGLMGIVWSYAISAGVGFFGIWIYTTRYCKNNTCEKKDEKEKTIDTQYAFSLLKTSWPLAASALFISIYYYIDTILIDFWWPANELGLYGAAYKLLIISLTGAFALVNILQPLLPKIKKEHPNIFNDFLKIIIRGIVIVIIPIIIACGIYARPIVVFIFGESFADAAPVFQILIFSAFFTYIGATLSATLQTVFSPITYTKIVAFGAFCNIVLNLLVIPHYGITGAAWVTLITEFVVTVYMLKKTAENTGIYDIFNSRFICFVLVVCGILITPFLFADYYTSLFVFLVMCCIYIVITFYWFFKKIFRYQ